MRTLMVSNGWPARIPAIPEIQPAPNEFGVTWNCASSEVAIRLKKQFYWMTEFLFDRRKYVVKYAIDNTVEHEFQTTMA